MLVAPLNLQKVLDTANRCYDLQMKLAESKAKGEKALLLVSSVLTVWGWWRGERPWAGRFGLSSQLCHTLLCGHIHTAPGLCFACLATLISSPLTSAEWLSLCSVHTIPLCIYLLPPSAVPLKCLLILDSIHISKAKPVQKTGHLNSLCAFFHKFSYQLLLHVLCS